MSMKKFFVSSCLLFVFAVAANAQTEKGTLLLGGNVTFTSIESTSSFTAAPNIGVFVINNLAVGAEASFFTSEGYNAWAVGPFARYYFGNTTTGKPFVAAGLNIGGGKDMDTETGFGAQAGYALFLNKSVALELAANYKRMSGVNVYGAGVGFQIHFKK